MVNYKFKEINAKEGRLLTDLSDIKNDFNITIAICDRLANMLKEDFYDIKLIESLFHAAIVRYAYPFIYRNGTKILETVVKGLPNKLRDDHYRFKDLRDRYVEDQKEKTIRENNKTTTYTDIKEPEMCNFKDINLDEINKLKALCNEFLKQISYIIKDNHSK